MAVAVEAEIAVTPVQRPHPGGLRVASPAMENRVHSGRGSRQGGGTTTIVSCRGPMSHSTRTWFHRSGTPAVRTSGGRRARRVSGSPGIWSLFQTVAEDVGGEGGPVPAGRLPRIAFECPWPKWPTGPGRAAPTLAENHRHPEAAKGRDMHRPNVLGSASRDSPDAGSDESRSTPSEHNLDDRYAAAPTEAFDLLLSGGRSL